MIPVVSDVGIKPPVVFRQAEDEVLFASSTQIIYNAEVQKALHGQSREGKFYEETEVQTFSFTYKLPDLFTEGSIELKESIVDCTKKEVFRANLVQSYIDADWQIFA